MILPSFSSTCTLSSPVASMVTHTLTCTHKHTNRLIFQEVCLFYPPFLFPHSLYPFLFSPHDLPSLPPSLPPACPSGYWQLECMEQAKLFFHSVKKKKRNNNDNKLKKMCLHFKHSAINPLLIMSTILGICQKIFCKFYPKKTKQKNILLVRRRRKIYKPPLHMKK